MDKEDYEDELQETFAAFASEYPNSALALITGLFGVSGKTGGFTVLTKP